MRTIEQRIYDIVAKNSYKPSQPMTTLSELGCDSLDCIEIAMDIEKELGLDIDASNWVTGDMSAHDIVCMVEYEYLGVRKEKL